MWGRVPHLGPIWGTSLYVSNGLMCLLLSLVGCINSVNPRVEHVTGAIRMGNSMSGSHVVLHLLCACHAVADDVLMVYVGVCAAKGRPA